MKGSAGLSLFSPIFLVTKCNFHSISQVSINPCGENELEAIVSEVYMFLSFRHFNPKGAH